MVWVLSLVCEHCTSELLNYTGQHAHGSSLLLSCLLCPHNSACSSVVRRCRLRHSSGQRLLSKAARTRLLPFTSMFCFSPVAGVAMVSCGCWPVLRSAGERHLNFVGAGRTEGGSGELLQTQAATVAAANWAGAVQLTAAPAMSSHRQERSLTARFIWVLQTSYWHQAQGQPSWLSLLLQQHVLSLVHCLRQVKQGKIFAKCLQLQQALQTFFRHGRVSLTFLFACFNK